MFAENLKIARIIVHEVFERTDDRKLVPPLFSDQLEQLPAPAQLAFRSRITEALSAQAKSLEMPIFRQGPGSHLYNVCELIQANEERFIEISKSVATQLSEAQLHRGIPGGMLIVFDGTVGVSNSRFVGVIKAETQSAFRRRKAGEAVVSAVTEFLENVFLTPYTRLYKIALFVQTKAGKDNAEDWTALVFDSNISQSHRESAAQYFYEGFLGCSLPEDGAYETSRFFELTKEFVRKADLEVEHKRDIVDALFTFVKAEQAKTFTSDEFGEKYLPTELRDSFSEFLEGKRFPQRAVVRDTTLVASKLRRRRFRFGADIELSVTPEALHRGLATMRTAPARELGGTEDEVWTQVTIKRSMTEER